MNKREKEVIQLQLKAEEDVIKELEKQYKAALAEINQKVKLFQFDIDMLDEALNADGLDETAKAVLQSQKRSKIYQKQYQEALQGQISGILDRMQGNNYSTIESYLKQSYEDAYIGTMYDIHGQGIPLVMPIDQAAAVKAIMTDSKISKGLYNSLGVDVNGLKKAIRQEITRGIGTGLLYNEIARNIANTAKAPLSRAKVIVRTEGHRIQQQSADDARRGAISRGCDVVKQWDAALDGKTRDNHRRLDGQIREQDEPFEVAGKKAMFPGEFGDPAEDCNCRCVALTRARWALDEDELNSLKERAEYFGLTKDKAKDFGEFKEKYLEATKKMAAETDSIDWPPKGEPISAAQYKEVMSYARSQGIELAGFKAFDGDITTVYDLIDDAVTIADLYPKASDGKRRLTIKLDSHLKSVDFAVTEGRIIKINANAYRDTVRLAEEYDKLVESGWFVKGTDYHAIIKHEMGHVVANVYDIDIMSVAEKVTGLKEPAAILDFFEENLSEYASKYADGGEIISECFASVYGSTETNKFALQFVEECDKLVTNSKGVGE